jgi:hypothetical protein
MMSTDMPTGRAALHPLWPDAHWNLSTLFAHDQITYHALAILKDRFGCEPNVDTIHGSPLVLWNSGRISRVPPSSSAVIEEPLKVFNDMGIGIYFTFSNHLLDENDLADKVCNRLLDMIDNDSGLNGVIVASDLLFSHVRREHPGLKLTASIVKAATENGKGNLDYYRRQTERFDSVMIHTDDGFNYGLLDQLDREKTEILVNENCVRNCGVRAQHYALLADQQRKGVPYTKQKGCLMPIQELDGRGLSCNFTDGEMKRVYDMGFRRFKLQGRGDKTWYYLYDLSRYLLDPTYVMPVFYKYIMMAYGLTVEQKARARQRRRRPQ